jgi:hypothetical protein
MNFRGLRRGNLSRKLATATIEEDDFVAGLEAKNVAAVVSLGACQVK